MVEAVCEAGEVRSPELIPELRVHNSDLSTEEFDTSAINKRAGEYNKHALLFPVKNFLCTVVKY